AGTYTVHTVFTDKADNTTDDATATITLDGTTPGTLAVEPVVGEPNVVDAVVTPGEDVDVTEVRIQPSNVLAPWDEESGTYRVRVDLRDAANGVNQLYASVGWTLPGGAMWSFDTARVPVTVVDAVAPAVTAPEPITSYRTSPDTWASSYV
ncbi:hypothetical protein ASC64_03135, partial [Nocardioides sp. Root122]